MVFGEGVDGWMAGWADNSIYFYPPTLLLSYPLTHSLTSIADDFGYGDGAFDLKAVEIGDRILGIEGDAVE
jgi:hypothetical protein